LLKFARDRTAYSHWLFEAKKRFCGRYRVGPPQQIDPSELSV
jgi:hypothetical protein